MKNLLRLFIFLIAGVVIIAGLNCHKSSTKLQLPIDSCGCNAVTIKAINTDTGVLFFNDNIGPQYEIQTGRWGLSSNYFLCDTTIPQLKNLERSVTYSVIFSGEISNSCIPDIKGGEGDIRDTMYDIKLTNLTILYPYCGCNSPVVQNIDSAYGSLYFDSTLYHQYYILAGTPGVQARFYVCDSNFSQLQSILQFPPDHTTNYWVIFSGGAEHFCTSDTIGYLDFMYNIHLTSIKNY